jgi:uncharacterized protein (TIGR03067 family)
MRRLFPLFAVLFVVPLCGSDSPKEYDDKTEVAGIEGTWRVIEFEYKGYTGKTPFQQILTIRKKTFTSDYRNGYTAEGCYCADRVCKPAHLDLSHLTGSYKGQTHKYNYQIDGETLRIAYIVDEREEQYPQGFKGDGVQVLIYKRVK